MAINPVGAGCDLFNLPASIAPVFERDREFWSLHATWREAEDAFEASPYFGDDPEGQLMLDRASELRDAMFLAPISTATALSAKLDVISQAGACGMVEMDIQDGLTVFEIIRRDCQRLAAAEVAAA